MVEKEKKLPVMSLIHILIPEGGICYDLCFVFHPILKYFVMSIFQKYIISFDLKYPDDPRICSIKLN